MEIIFFIQTLRKENILSKEGFILNAPTETQLQKHHLSHHKKKIHQLLQKSTKMILFKSIKGHLEHNLISAKGYIQSKFINLNINTEKFKTSTLKNTFNHFPNLELKGPLHILSNIKGPIKNPKITGHIKTNNLTFYGFITPKASLPFEFKNKKLYFTLNNTPYLNGIISGNSLFNFQETNPIYQLKLKGTQLKLNQLIPSLNLSGTSNIETSITYTNNVLTLQSTLNSKSTTFFKQHINTIQSHITFKDQLLNSLVTTLNINNSLAPILFTSQKTTKNIILSVEGTHILFQDIDPESKNKDPGILKLKGTISYPNKKISFKSLKKESSTSLNITLSDYSIYEQFFRQIDTQLHYHNNNLAIKTLTASNKNESVTIQGSFQDRIPNNLIIQLKTFKMENSKLFLKQLSPKFKPLEGILTLDAIAHQGNLLGHLKIQEGLFKNQPIQFLSSQFDWNKKKLLFTNTEIRHVNSELKLEGSINTNKTFFLKFQKGSQTNLSHFKPLLPSLDKFSGNIKLEGEIEGTPQVSTANLIFSIKNLHANNLSVDQLKGTLNYKNHQLNMISTTIKQNKSQMIIDGYWDISTLIDPGSKTSSYNISLSFIKTKLKDLSSLINTLYSEYTYYKNTKKVLRKTERIANANMTINVSKKETPFFKVSDSQFKTSKAILYKLSQSNTSLSLFNTIKDQQARLKNPEKTPLIPKIKGELLGTFHIKSQHGKLPLISTDLSLLNSQLLLLSTEKATLKLHSEKDHTSYVLILENGTLGTSSFKKIASKGTLSKKGTLSILNTYIHTSTRKSDNFLNGTLPLSPLWTQTPSQDKLKLNLHLKREDISILSIFNNQIKSIKNKGDIHLSLSGSLKKPILDTSMFNLNDFIITFHPKNNVTTTITIPKSNLKIQHNLLTIPNMPILLKKGAYDNQFNINGSIKFIPWQLNKWDRLGLDMTLKFNDTKHHIVYPNTYIGDLKLKNIQISGLYILPLSKKEKKSLQNKIETGEETGPTIKGELSLKNGAIKIPKNDSSSRQYLPSYLLDVTLAIKKDIFLEGNALGKGIFSGISTDLEISPTLENIHITGTLNSPVIQDTLYLKNGALNMFNHSFVLLQEENSSTYYPNDPPQKNSIGFEINQNEKGRIFLTPLIDIIATTIVDQQVPTDDQTTAPYLHVNTKLKGPISKLDQIEFDIFESQSNLESPDDATLSQHYTITNEKNIDNTQSAQATYDIVKLLMPEFFSSEDNKNEKTPSDFLNKVGENQINFLFRKSILRPLEKNISNKIGLYDLKIDYNIGQDISSFLGQEDPTQRRLGINAIQKLSDNLHLRIKTDMDLKAENSSEENKLNISEIELTYYLLKNLSINYASIQDETDRQNKKYRLSLRFSHAF